MSGDVQSHFQRGISYLNNDQVTEAIDAFALVISSPDVSLSLKAQALNHRGFANWKAGSEQAARADWSAVVDLPGADAEHRSMALRALARLEAAALYHNAEEKKGLGDAGGAVSDFSVILRLENGHDFERRLAAQRLLEIPNLPTDRQDEERCAAEVTRGHSPASGGEGGSPPNFSLGSAIRAAR